RPAENLPEPPESPGSADPAAPVGDCSRARKPQEHRDASPGGHLSAAGSLARGRAKNVEGETARQRLASPRRSLTF
ncbi:MAG: hypothetical protein LBU12_04720, partial [Deltaproteobacteria bacterium]|nr:hypothetical protein [Deltaproteobacteria bacterium]